MPIETWPLSDTVVIHAPIGHAVSYPLTVLDGAGYPRSVQGMTLVAMVYNKLSRTVATSGSAVPVDAPAGEITVDFTAAQTSPGSERRAYYWTLVDTASDTLLFDGPFRFHLPGNTPQTPYRGRVVRSPLSVLT